MCTCWGLAFLRVGQLILCCGFISVRSISVPLFKVLTQSILPCLNDQGISSLGLCWEQQRVHMCSGFWKAQYCNNLVCVWIAAPLPVCSPGGHAGWSLATVCLCLDLTPTPAYWDSVPVLQRMLVIDWPHLAPPPGYQRTEQGTKK